MAGSVESVWRPVCQSWSGLSKRALGWISPHARLRPAQAELVPVRRVGHGLTKLLVLAVPARGLVLQSGLPHLLKLRQAVLAAWTGLLL